MTIEAPAGVALAALALGERLAPAQLAGAVLVLGAIVLLQVRGPASAPSNGRGAVASRGLAAAEPAEAFAA